MRVRDEFEQLGELGVGAHGRVFMARQLATGRMVAIKSLYEQLDDPAQHARFEREANIRIPSPHVVRVLETRLEGAQVYIVMEWIDGPSCEAALREGPFGMDRALCVGRDVARALMAAHSLGVIHRDVKPSNVLLAPDGRAMLTDFGIAKVRGSGTLTATGHGLGTLAYCAPEQVEDAKNVGETVDLYGLGATLYHLISGVPPLSATNQADLIGKIFSEDPMPLTGTRDDCPDAVAEVIHALLEKDPLDRPPHARSVLTAIEELLEA